MRLISTRRLSASGNKQSCLGPVFLTIYDFGSRLFSETLMSDGYFQKILEMKVTKTCPKYILKVSKGVKIRNRYNKVPHLTQDTNGKVTNSQLDTTNESQEVSPFPAGDHRAHINRHAQRHSKHKTEQKHKRSTKKYCHETFSKIFYWRA